MGTPDFAAASLKRLSDEKYNIVGVITQPDKPKGRGLKQSYSDVKTLAIQLNLPVYQPDKLRDVSTLELFQALSPDLIIVVAYGQIIPDEIISLPRYGAINVHGSLLPAYRGAAPIQRAVINGDKITGVTTMYLSSELDAGDMIFTESTPIGDYETSGQLFDRLKELGADLLIKTVMAIESGNAPRTAQDSKAATYAKMLDKSEAPINWNKQQREIIKQIYGMQPWPGATAQIGDTTCKIFSAVMTDNSTVKSAGSVVYCGNEGIEISCADGKTIMIKELQAPGKKRMNAADYVRGHKLL